MKSSETGWFEGPKGLHSAAVAEQSDHANALLEAGKNRLAVLREENETNPQIDDKEWANDVRYKTGMAAGIAWFLSLPEEARELVAEQTVNRD